MKPLPLILAALAFSVPVVQAAVYDITLTNATKYTQCQIKYRGSSTKFVGKDKSGKVQTVVVPSSRILNIREAEVETEPTPEPSPVPPAEPNAETTAAQETPEAASETTVKDAEKPAENEAKAPSETATPAEEKQNATQEDQPDQGQAQNATLRLRETLTKADEAYKALRAPSKSLERRQAYTRERIIKSLDKLDQQALKVAELQQEFNRAGRGDFAFALVSEEQRTQYERDGQAAYKAMLIDMKEKPGARKVGGIDKFEILRDRYQGIPEYKMAYEWYIKTLNDLDKKWSKMLANEQKRRKTLQPAKKAAMADADAKQLEELRASFEADGEDIAAVWFNPRPRNMEMLRLANNKVHDALRRNQGAKLDEAVGTVPSLLTQFWTAMDEARRLLIEGQLDQAEEVLTKDGSYDLLRRIHPSIFGKEYRDPIMEQRKKLEDEIRTRKRNVRNTMTKLEREASQLQRATGSAEAQINALMEEIEREKNLDAGDNTVAMEENMAEPEETETPSDEQPKAPEASATPAAAEPQQN